MNRAVITAGGLVDGDFATAIGSRVKALARFGERRLIDIALDACQGAEITGVAVVAESEIAAHLAGRDVRIIDAAEDGAANVLRALDAWPGERFVYLTSDLPFAAAPALREFIARSEPYAITMALADVDAYETRFPGAPEHSVAIGGERVANGNAFVLAPEAIGAVRTFAARFFEARKSLLRMALLLGPSMIARFATKRLSIGGLELHAQRRLGVPVAAIRGCDPGLCYDVDSLAEYHYACTHAEAPV